MDIGKIGIWSVELRSGDAGEVREAAAELDELGWGALWIPGLGGNDALSVAERLLAATKQAAVALGVLNMWMYDPVTIAAQHAQLQQAYTRRLLLGLGVSSPAAAQRMGRDFGNPIAAMNDYLDRIDASATPVPPRERILAALGPKMIALAAQRTAGVHPFLVTPEYSAAARQQLGPGLLLAPHQAVVLESDAEQARAIARAAIGFYLQLPSYTNNLRRMDFGDDDLVKGGSDRLIDRLIAWGDVETIAARVRAHHDAGADHVALQVLTAQPKHFPRREWRELARLTR